MCGLKIYKKLMIVMTLLGLKETIGNLPIKLMTSGIENLSNRRKVESPFDESERIKGLEKSKLGQNVKEIDTRDVKELVAKEKKQ